MSSTNHAVVTTAPVAPVAVPGIFSMIGTTIMLTGEALWTGTKLVGAAAKTGIVEAQVGLLVSKGYETKGIGVCDARTKARAAKVAEIKARQAELAAELAELEG